MSLKLRIWLLPLVVALMFGLGVSVVAWFTAHSTATIARLGDTDYPYMSGVTEFANQLEAMVATVQSAVAEGEKERLKDVAERAAVLRKQLAMLQALPGKADAMQALGQRFDDYAATSLDAAAILLKAKAGDAGQAVPRMQDSYRKLEQAVNDTRDQARSGVDGAIADAQRDVRSSLVATVGCALVVVAALALGSAVLVRSVWRQIGGEPEYARSVMQRMAGGDLSMRIDLGEGGSPSLLSAVRDTGQGLSRLVCAVRESSQAMAGTSHEMASGNQNLSSRTEETAANLQQTALSMQQLTQTVAHSVDSAREATDLSSSAGQVAARGGEIVSRVVRTMDSISASSRKISEITSVIDSIAFQTNILALNAAVEAARAGEQGRGFAVVATEVRNLAQRSAEAAKEIRTLIGASAQEVESGARLVAEAGHTMGEIVDSVQRVTAIIEAIAMASSEQSEGIAKINIAVGELDRMTQENAALVQRSAASAASLSDQTTKLSDAVTVFRVDEAADPQPAVSA